MADLFLVTHRPDSGTGKNRADGSSLVKKHTHKIGKKLGGTTIFSNLVASPSGKILSTSCLSPDADETPQAPKIDQQDLSVFCASDRWDQELLDNVKLPADKSSKQYAGEEGRDDFAGSKTKKKGNQCGQDGPEAEIV